MSDSGISTPPMSGTTWTQGIVSALLWPDGDALWDSAKVAHATRWSLGLPSRGGTRELLEVVCAAANVALERERLQAELESRVEELAGSRARLVAAGDEVRRRIERAFDEIDAALAAGELVGIFPEGTLTRDGDIAPFKSGVERILARRPVPVAPLALRGLWSSMWSRRDSRLGRMRVPRRFRAHVGLVAGEPMAADASARELEARVRELRGGDV